MKTLLRFLRKVKKFFGRRSNLTDQQKKYLKIFILCHNINVLRQVELIEKVKSYDPFVKEELLNKAYVYSMKAHGSQKGFGCTLFFSSA